MRGGSAVAEIKTGPRRRKAKGFSRPPVRYKSAASSAVSNVSSQAARSGSSHWVCRKLTRSATFNSAAKAITARHAQIGTSNSEAKSHPQTGGERPESGEPAQPDQRVQPYVAGPFMSSGQTE